MKYTQHKTTIHRANCSDYLQGQPDNSFDSIVTDPPYGLSNHRPADIVDALTCWLAGKEYTHGKAGFMGKEWDSFVPGPEIWRECYRVLKPGGYMLVFAGSRTADLMGIALRLSGFTMHPSIGWCYAQGFPKATDLSKILDKDVGAEREKINHKPRPATSGTFSGKSETRPWIEKSRENGYHETDGPEPVTPEARRWEGWKYGLQSLKPALEPILMVQKPIDGKRMVDNVRKWGTGAVNVDGCRVKGEPPSVPQPMLNSPTGKIYGFKTREGRNGEMSQASGRYPGNLYLDGSPAVQGLFPETSSGYMAAGTKRQNSSNPGKNTYGHMEPDTSAVDTFGDSGSAARFFHACPYDELDAPALIYEAKASREDRGRGNRHPTVKPVALIRQLMKLITPPGGRCLDPFLGSGTGAIAAHHEGFHFEGVEMDEKHFQFCIRRIREQASQMNIL